MKEVSDLEEKMESVVEDCKKISVNVKNSSSKTRCVIPARYIFACFAHLGIAVSYSLRVNMSVAIVAMVNSTYAKPSSNVKLDPECGGDDARNSSLPEVSGHFNWDQEMQGAILSSFFYGYLVTQMPAAYLSSKFGGKWVFGLGMLWTSLLTIVTPVATQIGPNFLIAIRVVEGIGEGVTFPAVQEMLSRWSPPFDRSKLTGIAFSGACTGTIISYVTSGFLCKYGFAGGWPSVFYIFGICGVVWFIAWSFLVYSTPEGHPRISPEELKHILQTTADTVAKEKRRRPVPWFSILTSRPCWAFFVVYLASNWMLYVMVTSLPSYLKDVLNFSIQENGLTSALPFVVIFLSQMISSVIADYLISRGLMSTAAVRKAATAIGCFVEGGVLIGLSFMGCSDAVLAVVLMTFGLGFGGFNSAGYLSNPLDIAPNFASVLVGIGNTVGTISGCIAPLAVGYFTENEPTRRQWQKVFFLSSGIICFGGLVFILFGSGVEQPWNHVTENLIVNQGHSDDETKVHSSEIEPLLK